MVRKNELERLRRQFPTGRRVELVEMDDQQAPPPGTRGVIEGIDGAGDLQVRWDTGSSLSSSPEWTSSGSPARNAERATMAIRQCLGSTAATPARSAASVKRMKRSQAAEAMIPSLLRIMLEKSIIACQIVLKKDGISWQGRAKSGAAQSLCRICFTPAKTSCSKDRKCQK